MPLLDTVVLFGTADSEDRHHERSMRYLQRIIEPEFYLGCFALIEFDIILKSRGFSYKERMDKHASILKDYPDLARKVATLSPATIYLTAKLESEVGLEYFDAGIAAEAFQLDGMIISTDTAFDRIEGLKRIW